MKKFLMILVLTFTVTLTHALYADTCPPIKGLDPFHPPAGWTLLMPPIIPGQDYTFIAAIHSLNGSYYFKQVICKYATAASDFSPAFALLSDRQYEKPQSKMPPWNARSTIAFTLTCMPPNHDESVCVFE